MSASERVHHPNAGSAADTATAEWPLLPTETEIYILPDGRVVIADLPTELADLLARLGKIEAAPALGVGAGE